MKNILFIGLGRMGFPMAGHLAKNKNFTVSVYNRSAETITRWVANPSATAYTPSMTTADVQQVLNTLASQVAAIPSQLNRSDTLQAQAQQAVTRLHNLLDTAKATLNDSHLQQAFTALLPQKSLQQFVADSQQKGFSAEAMWQNVIKAVHDYADLDSVGCFVAGTLVNINNEDKIIPIEELVVGDEVLSKPETGNGETAYKPVVETFAYEDKPIWLLSVKHSVAFRDYNGEIAVRYQNRNKYIFDEGKVLVTPNHPVFVVGIMNDKLTVVNFYEQPVWKRVDELQRYEVVVNADGVMYQVERAQPVYRYQGIGENTVNPDHYWYQQNYYGDFETYYQAEVEMLDGEAEPLWKTEEDYKAWGYVYDVISYEKERYSEYVTQGVNTLKDGDEYMPFTRKVYNLEVADNHTYFVSLADLWVHNTSSPAQKLLQTARELANGVNAINETELNSTYEIAKQYWQNAGASVESEWNNCDFDERQIQQVLFDD